MPRAHRYFLPGHVWHITHRCHQKEFLLKFAKDRRRWLYWLFEAKKRYGLCVLDYVVTSNHIHLLVKDTGAEIIPRSMQLIAGRTAQEYNHRKGRKGAYWEDRYHATAVEADEHFIKCITYIDLNMVRAGVVAHPRDWPESGFREIQSPPQRYRIIDLECLMELCGISNMMELQRWHHHWIEQELQRGNTERDAAWTKSVAVGSEMFVRNIQSALGIKSRYKLVREAGAKYVLKESVTGYGALSAAENEILRVKNIWKWNIF